MYRRLQFLGVGAINLTSMILTTIFAIVLALKGYGYYAIIAKAVLTSIFTFILSLIFAKTRYRLELDKATFQAIFGFSGWLMASGFFRNLAHNVDKLLMSRLLSVTSLGAYNRPKDFINQISTQLNGIFDTVLFPILSGVQDSKEKLRQAFLKSLNLLNIMAMLLTLSFVVNSELLIRVFFGEKWLDLKVLTMVLSFLLLFNIDGRLADCFLRSIGLTKQQFYFRIIETIVSLIGVVIGSFWDLMGVAVAIVVTNAILKMAKIIYISYKINLPISRMANTVLKSWRFSLFVVPLCVIMLLFIPSTIQGNVIQLVIYIVTVAIVFLAFPNLVGEEYKETVYTKVLSETRKYYHKIFRR